MRSIALLGLLAAISGGCIHARTAEPPAEAESVSPASPGSAVAALPGDLFEPDGIARIQSALDRRGYGVAATGVLDAATENALEQFQASEDLPPTGLPDHETLRRLEIDPARVFRSAADAAAGTPPVGN